jgi:hypothetical protein
MRIFYRNHGDPVKKKTPDTFSCSLSTFSKMAGLLVSEGRGEDGAGRPRAVKCLIARQDPISDLGQWSGDHRLYDAYRRIRGHDSGEAKAGLAEERAILRLRPFLSAGTDEHHHVEHLSRVRRIVGWQHHLNDQDTAGRGHGAPAVAQDRQALLLVPIVNDV